MPVVIDRCNFASSGALPQNNHKNYSPRLELTRPPTTYQLKWQPNDFTELHVSQQGFMILQL